MCRCTNPGGDLRRRRTEASSHWRTPPRRHHFRERSRSRLWPGDQARASIRPPIPMSVRTSRLPRTPAISGADRTGSHRAHRAQPPPPRRSVLPCRPIPTAQSGRRPKPSATPLRSLEPPGWSWGPVRQLTQRQSAHSSPTEHYWSTTPTPRQKSNPPPRTTRSALQLARLARTKLPTPPSQALDGSRASRQQTTYGTPSRISRLAETTGAHVALLEGCGHITHRGQRRPNAHRLLPGSRVRPLDRFPYLVFYVVGDQVVDVWRILHARRDIPSAIGDEIGT